MTPDGVHLLGSLAEELGYPYEWGDPTRLPNTSAEARAMILEARANAAKNKAKDGEAEAEGAGDKLTGRKGPNPGFVLNGAAGPRGRGEMGGMPCELVHCGVGGANCYKNALYRWIRGWRMSMAIYFPVHLLPRLLFNPKGFLKTPIPNLIKVLTGAARSAAFLATYIVGNWFPSASAALLYCHASSPTFHSTFGTAASVLHSEASLVDSASLLKRSERGQRWHCTSHQGRCSPWWKAPNLAG